MLRLLNINTWHGLMPRNVWWVESIEPPGHKELRRLALVEGIRALDPDAIFFQECLPQPAFSEEIAKELGYDVVTKVCNSGMRLFGVGVPPGIGTGEGVSILAKPHLEMKKLGVRRLSGFGISGSAGAFQLGQLRFALAARVVADGKPVVLVNTHLRYAYPRFDTFQRAWDDLKAQGTATGQPGKMLVSAVRRNMRIRDEELARLGEWAAIWMRQSIPVVIGTDLNLEHDSNQVLRFVDEHGICNVLPETGDPTRTWDPEGNTNIAFSTSKLHADGTPKDLALRLVAHYDGIPQCPDHLLLGPTFHRQDLRDGGLALHQPHEDVFASDHYGIFADVVVR